MIDLNVTNFITIGLIALLFAWVYNTFLKPVVQSAVA